MQSYVGDFVRMNSDGVVRQVLELYSSLTFRPPPEQFTILAAFVLSTGNSVKIISLATGSKCLPATRLPQQGDALHDSHAEILARRAATRWFLEEITRCVAQGGSQWIEKGNGGLYALKGDVHMHMYVSTPPCAWMMHFSSCINIQSEILKVAMRPRVS